MWVVAKFKKNNEETFKKELNSSLNNTCKFYQPFFELEIFNKNGKKIKKRKKNLLDNYIFCFSESFGKYFALSKLKYTKGLECFLNGTTKDSKEIEEFVSFCKNNENSEGTLKNSFFFNFIKSKAMIGSGPLANVILDTILIKENKLRAYTGNLKITLTKNSESYCYPV
jgi:hypothetical protein